MSTMTVRLPESLHDQLKDLAKAEGISINQFLVVAAAEKMSALKTVEFLESEAKLASRKGFKSVLRKVPDVQPDEADQL
ncbi:type II toxin-antitoxin system HicB family antitoxin [Granulosicoccus sp.]|nr:toxin-antitoxin system HicB family antitoxin [Granulosicoccus sp.]MDB4224465.1 type II toxin-antitoxin system HicB family antitoxin [Granulosicoccus sp.]